LPLYPSFEGIRSYHNFGRRKIFDAQHFSLDSRLPHAYTVPMLDGQTRLREWLRRSMLSQRAGAELLGMHFTFINKILRCGRAPSLATAIRIERVTGIPVEAWMPTGVDGKPRDLVICDRKGNVDKVETGSRRC
jgi:hypothetical protein